MQVAAMKVYTKAVYQMTDAGMELIPEESSWYDYDGPVAELKGPKAPTPPDPNVVSAAQTKSNKDTAEYNAALNRYDVYTPLGSSVYSQTGTDASGAPLYRQDVTLTPLAQEQFDRELAQNNRMNELAGALMGQVEGSTGQPLDTSSLPDWSYGVTGNLPALKTSADGAAAAMGVNSAGLPQLYGAEDLLGARQQAQDSLYKRQSAFLDPQWQQRESDLTTMLANQGVVEGSEAWQRARDQFNREREFAYGQARDAAITGGLGEMTGLSGIARGNRSDLFGERAASAQVQNQGAAIQNQFGLQNAALNNQAQQQAFAQALANAQFGNQARGQALDEMFAVRNDPLNRFNALRSSSPVQMPNFSQSGQVSMQPTDVAGNIWNAYNGQMNIWNAQQQANNGLLGGLMGLGGTLGGAAIMASDERAKDDITAVGELPGGLGLYDYEYKGDPLHERHVGVMAQEVEQDDPQAVITGADGVKRVNYSRVLARALMRAA